VTVWYGPIYRPRAQWSFEDSGRPRHQVTVIRRPVRFFEYLSPEEVPS
jgi:hypothetical protein